MQKKVVAVIVPEWDFRRIVDGRKCYLSIKEGCDFLPLCPHSRNVYTMRYHSRESRGDIEFRGGGWNLYDRVKEALVGNEGRIVFLILDEWGAEGTLREAEEERRAELGSLAGDKTARKEGKKERR